jgi:DNA-binding winged helix-turn-helix (wHTH) protein
MSRLYHFGDFALDPRRRLLTRAGSSVSLTSKAFDLLHFLVQNPNRLIMKDELLQSVWGDAFVEEGNLTQYISHLRKALGESSEDARLIVTVARKGYQFISDVTPTERLDAAKRSPAPVLTTELSPADAQPAFRGPTDAAIATVPRHWWKAAFAVVFAAFLAAVCFASWRQFEGKTPLSSRVPPRLTSPRQPELAESQPVNPEAFDAYLQGHYYFERGTEKDTNMAARYFERATQLDPTYALAWVGLSRARNWQVVTGLVPSESGHRSAREAVERALALNPNLALAHAQVARLKRQVDFDWAGSSTSIQKANVLEAGNPEIIRFAALNAAILGRFDEALPLARQAVDLDPLNAGSWQQLGEIDFFEGDLDKAEAACKRAQELRPDHYRSPTFLTYIYAMQGRPQEAFAEIKRVDSDHIRTFLNAVTYHALGREKESDAALRELIAKYEPIDPYLIALVYAFRNQSDEAFVWLNRAYAARNDGLIFIKVEPLMKSLHNDPRFAAFLKKLNLPT